MGRASPLQMGPSSPQTFQGRASPNIWPELGRGSPQPSVPRCQSSCGRQTPCTSPGKCVSAVGLDLALQLPTPRHVIIRSVPAQRTTGVRGMLPALELCPPILDQRPGTAAAGGLRAASPKACRTIQGVERPVFETAHVGGPGGAETPQAAAVAEAPRAGAAAVTASVGARAQTAPPRSRDPKGQPQPETLSPGAGIGAGAAGAAGPALLQQSPGGQSRRLELSPDLRQSLKERLGNLRATGNQDFQNHPRGMKAFLKELQETCELFQAPLQDRSYRAPRDCHRLHHFLQLLPQIKDAADLPPIGSDLAKFGWFTLTLLLAIVKDVWGAAGNPWEFTYNSLTYRVCNCRSRFPGFKGCVCPTVGEPLRPGLRDPACSREKSKAAMHAHKVAQDFKAAATNLRRQERHFPARILHLAEALSARFKEFVGQLSTFLDDFALIPESGGTQGALWDHFVMQFLTEISILDSSYVQFERQLFSLVGGLVGGALAPVEFMTGLSGALLGRHGDPFREVQMSLFCQRLGLLKRQVSFGGPFNIVYFDSGLLIKAQRVVQMGTYMVIQELAQRLLAKFDALCQVLSSCRAENLQPEAASNLELKAAVLDLEAIWAECLFLLQQETLDFIGQMLAFLRGGSLDSSFLWQLRLAMFSGDEAAKQEDTELKEARLILFTTLPMLLYIDEVWTDICAEREEKKAANADRFRELFYPKEDQHASLRIDFAKLDLDRIGKLCKLIMEDVVASQDSTFITQQRPGAAMAMTKAMTSAKASAHEKLLIGMHGHLKELVSFAAEDPQVVICAATGPLEEETSSGAPLGAAEMKAARGRRQAQEAHARWVCVQRVAQAVEPQLFPAQRPGGASPNTSTRGSISKPRGGKVPVSEGRRRSFFSSPNGPPK